MFRLEKRDQDSFLIKYNIQAKWWSKFCKTNDEKGVLIQFFYADTVKLFTGSLHKNHFWKIKNRIEGEEKNIWEKEREREIDPSECLVSTRKGHEIKIKRFLQPLANAKRERRFDFDWFYS